MPDESGWCTCSRRIGITAGCPVHDRPARDEFSDDPLGRGDNRESCAAMFGWCLSNFTYCTVVSTKNFITFKFNKQADIEGAIEEFETMGYSGLERVGPLIVRIAK